MPGGEVALPPMKQALIQPTGAEICSGVVQDTDSPMVRDVLEELGFSAAIAPPLPDAAGRLEAAIAQAGGRFQLMVLIGGSGGGRRYDPALAVDVTHRAMERALSGTSAVSLYGKNGHLWSRLVCGFREDMLVINLHGPYPEAQAAIAAFAAAYRRPGWSPETVSRAMAEAVCAVYGSGGTL